MSFILNCHLRKGAKESIKLPLVKLDLDIEERRRQREMFSEFSIILVLIQLTESIRRRVFSLRPSCMDSQNDGRACCNLRV
jgi:hypothetical protein